MYILGLSCYYHDSAACLLRDGQVIAAVAEERFSRLKHDNRFPFHAINYCLDYAGIAANQIDKVVFYEKPIIKFDRIINQYLDTFPKSFSASLVTTGQWFHQKLQINKTFREKFHYQKPLLYCGHHLSHAASSYYLSKFKDAVIITLDGVGEWSTTTIGTGKNGLIKIDKEINFPHSLGLLYSAITTYLGFSANDAEYKVMGLAAYGNPKPYSAHFDKLITQFNDGSYQLNMEYFSFDWSDHTMFSSNLVDLFGQPPRDPESVMENCYQDIAASLQQKLEELVVNLATNAHKHYQLPNLCLAGGVALNSVVNGKILQRTPFKQLYIPPDPGDAGGAMGAALYVHYQDHPYSPEQQSFSPFLGPSYSWYQIKKTLDQSAVDYEFYDSDKRLTARVAKLLKQQRIIGWFQGRLEWGPRALGNRSILASAATVKMRDVINTKVKHRELFRPFAPVILEQYTKDYFETDKNIPISARYMLMVYPFKQKGFKDVPAVVHVDGTGRLQTLVRNDNPLYYDLIEKYRNLTKVPIIINTSFNIRGEPIVCSPQDAINCFLNTDIDYLIIGNFICRKKESSLKH